MSYLTMNFDKIFVVVKFVSAKLHSDSQTHARSQFSLQKGKSVINFNEDIITVGNKMIMRPPHNSYNVLVICKNLQSF